MSWSDDLPAYVRRCIAEAATHDEKTVLELVDRARKGDTRAADILVRQFMGYALAVASAMERAYSYRVAAEDFLQAALEGLLETIRVRYEPERGAKFTTVAWFWMRKRCFMLAAELGYPLKRPRSETVGTVPFDAPVRTDGCSVAEAKTADGISPETATVITVSWRMILASLVRAVNGLDDVSRASVIRRHLCESGLLPALDGPIAGLHRITLWRKERHALHRIRVALTGGMPEPDIIGTLRLIDANRETDGLDDSLELACTA